MRTERSKEENVTEINIPSNLFTEFELQPTEENEEDGQIYYTILENDVENYTLDTEQDLLSTSNILYLSLNNDETQESESTEIKEEITEHEVSNEMEFVEKITLMDGTEAYMTRNLQSKELYVKEEQEIQSSNSTILLNEDANNGSEEEDDMLTLPECTENSLPMPEYDEIKEPTYEQVQLEDGGVVLIEVGLYNSILEQSKKKEQKVSKCFHCPNEKCDKSYTTMHHLRVHMRNHFGLRPYQCSVEGCEKTFATGYSLKAHSRTHTGEKPYGCKTCHKSFKTSGDLQKHIRIHTGEKPFMCPIEGCGRSFTTSNIRKVHIRSHTGERPYQCPEPGCLKAFASATNYKNHIRIHSGEKPYACSVEGCGKRFTEYSSLYKHQMVHVNANPCKCEYCGRICRQQSTLIVHKRLVHDVIVTEDGTELMLKMVDGASAGTSDQSVSIQNESSEKHILILSK